MGTAPSRDEERETPMAIARSTLHCVSISQVPLGRLAVIRRPIGSLSEEADHRFTG
jgi:hypothetical protein